MHLNDFEEVNLAEKEYVRFKASGEDAIPLEEVMKQYGMKTNTEFVDECRRQSLLIDHDAHEIEVLNWIEEVSSRHKMP